MPVPQLHDLNSLLASEEHPHNPKVHVFGKLPALAQQDKVVTVPPESMQAISSADGRDKIPKTMRIEAMIATSIKENIKIYTHFPIQ